jgi:molecular chaperone HtpG
VPETFQVDLRGIVDLLSHHLYSSPRVYLRELLQNGVDAITARRATEPDAPATVRILPAEATGDGTLRIHDSGIGLTETEVHTLLATIGRSSKRDELNFARHEFLGQFGIGLLSCFLVADEIGVVSRSATGSAAVAWTARSDGTYEVGPGERAEPGTTVTLVPRAGCAHWLEAATVTRLATLFGELLPVPVHVGEEPIAGGDLPWSRTAVGGRERRERLRAYGERVFGFTPFDVIDLTVPEAGLTGVAFVLPTPANPAARGAHRVYLKRMLLAEHTEGLLPEWAFFVRCVVDSTELRPTASREALYDDELTESTRVALGEQLRGWLVRLSATDPDRMADFLRTHHLGVKAMAVHDEEMLRLVDRWLPFETSDGALTLAEFRRRHGTIRYTPSVDEFRQISAVATAQGIGVVNAGYAYETELLERLPAALPDAAVRRLDPADLAARFGALDPDTALALHGFTQRARAALERLDCDVSLREFDPVSLAALYLLDADAAHRAELRATRDSADPLWAEVLDAFDDPEAGEHPQLVLNYRNPLVRRITQLTDPELTRTAVEALYGQALLLGHHPLRAADSALLNRAFLGLLDWAVKEEQ